MKMIIMLMKWSGNEIMGEKASGFCAKLRIAEIHTPMYRANDYDGNESIETPYSYNWVVINE